MKSYILYHLEFRISDVIVFARSAGIDAKNNKFYKQHRDYFFSFLKSVAFS